MVLDMRVTGKMIYNMGLVKKYGLIIQNMRESIMKERSTERVIIYGQMEVDMKEIGMRIE